MADEESCARVVFPGVHERLLRLFPDHCGGSAGRIWRKLNGESDGGRRGRAYAGYGPDLALAAPRDAQRNPGEAARIAARSVVPTALAIRPLRATHRLHGRQ